MSFTAKINRIRKILGKDEHFQREKKFPLFELVVALSFNFYRYLQEKSNR